MCGIRRLFPGIAITLLLVFAGCNPAPESSKPSNAANEDAPPRSQAKALEGEKLREFLTAHQQGLGAMEQYDYSTAVAAFRKALALAPDMNAAKVNLAIALLNDSGERAEKDKSKQRGQPNASALSSNFEEALGLLDDVIKNEPDNLHAHYCRGVILEYVGRTAESHEEYQRVVEGDPSDGHALLKMGMTLPDPKRAGFPAGPDQAERLIEIYSNALKLMPYNVTAMYRLQQALTWGSAFGARDNPQRKAELDHQREAVTKDWARLDRAKDPAGSGEALEISYGDTGRYANVVDPFGLRADNRAPALRRPIFESPKALEIALGEGEHWPGAADFVGALATLGRVRARFGVALITADFDADGNQDLFICAGVKGTAGIRDALWLSRGDGRLEDVTKEWGVATDRPSVGAAAADFDADGLIDLCLTALGEIRLLRNTGKAFEDVTTTLALDGEPALNLAPRWLDIDQDGDLDLYVVRYCPLGEADKAFSTNAPSDVAGTPDLAFRNDGKPTPLGGDPKGDAPAATDFYNKATQGLSIAWHRWDGPESAALLGGNARHTGIAALDLDVDRDLDFVLTNDGAAPTVAINDRLGRFHEHVLKDLEIQGLVNGAAVLDLEKDGRPDLVLVRPDGRLNAFRNQPTEHDAAPGFALTYYAIDARLWRQAQVLDLDLDSWTDLLGLPLFPEGDAPAPAWARNEGSRLAPIDLALGPDSPQALSGLLAVNLAGNALPDLIMIRDGVPPRVSIQSDNGNRWLGLALGGRWKFGKGSDGGPSRTNPQAIGTRVLLQGPELSVSYDHVPMSSGLGQSAGPIVLGLGEARQALLLRLTWPDGVMQSELNVQADQVLALREANRKTGSCPVLFTFDGERMVCLGDFLGGGGLGYLVAPGSYGVPDRDEAMAIRGDQLKPVDGVFRLSITEPMDEIAYLDKVTLEVVDRPPGVDVVLDERFAPGGNRPSGDLLAFRQRIEPTHATDLDGNDVTERLRAFDNSTLDGFKKLPHWIGYAQEHGVVLDFGRSLEEIHRDDRVFLCVAGWVEYPYSQTNYAAATAGLALAPPVLELRRADGTWEVIEADPGYPAGLPRMTALEITGKLGTGPCVLRIRTNMECYFDQIFLMRCDSNAGLRRLELPVEKAVLGFRGYMREISADGRPPLLYDYASVDPAPLARLTGNLTRYGDVAPLLRSDDDQLCLVGPGDEVAITIRADQLPPLPEGWSRSYVLRAVGYCKDADPFTSGSDTVGPLPYRNMPAHYPFEAKYEHPRDPAYARYLETFQTREARNQ